MAVCSKCQAQMKKVGDFHRCPKCELYCQKCGSQVSTFNTTCPKCKTKLKLSNNALAKLKVTGGWLILIFGGLTYLMHKWMNSPNVNWSPLTLAIAGLWFYLFLISTIIAIIVFISVKFSKTNSKKKKK